MFSFGKKLESKPYQVPTRHIAYALQKPFKEQQEGQQQQDIIIALGINEMAEWCNIMLVPKPNGKVRLCLDQARIKQALIQPVHKGLTLNDIFQKVTNAKYVSL